jgi:IS5 family transposase
VARLPPTPPKRTIDGSGFGYGEPALITRIRYLATILITLLLAVPAMSVELFRYRGVAKDGGTLEYVFEAVNRILPTP